MHIVLDEGILREDDTPLGNHQEVNFVRMGVIHSPDEGYLRQWAASIYRQDLGQSMRARQSVDTRIEAIRQKISNVVGEE